MHTTTKIPIFDETRNTLTARHQRGSLREVLAGCKLQEQSHRLQAYSKAAGCHLPVPVPVLPVVVACHHFDGPSRTLYTFYLYCKYGCQLLLLAFTLEQKADKT